MAGPDDEQHEWVARLLAADDPGAVPPAVAARIEDSLRAAAGAQTTGERPRVFGGSAPARPSPFATPSRTGRSPGGPRPAGDATGPQPAVAGARRSGSRRGRREEAAEARRHLTLYRVLPAAAAVAVLAVGVGVVVDLARGPDDAAQDETALAGPAESAADAGPPPNGLVATGTAYTEADLGQQALDLVAAVGAGEAPAAQDVTGEAAEAVDEDAAGGSAASPDSGVVPLPAGRLASADGFRACALGLGAPEDTLPVAVDLATFEGTDAAVVVLPNRAGDGYEIIVTDRACDPGSQRATATVLAP